jgi:hypothetical protein
MPSVEQALQILADPLPALRHMVQRAKLELVSARWRSC